MKKLLLPVFAASTLLLGSCSTSQLAGQADSNDDVYYTEAKAKVIQPAPERVQSSAPASAPGKSYRTDEQLYRDNEYSDNGYRDSRYDDDYSYSSRINRFYYNSPYRPYYDRYSYGYNQWYGYNPWYSYSYDPFFYDPWMYRPGVSVWVGTGRYGSPYNYGYYGSRYNNNFWGPYSYYNTYPGYNYGGGYYNGGGYYSGGSVYNNPNHRARPDRESGMGRSGNNDPQTGVYIPPTGRPNRGASVPNRQTPDGRISSSDQGSSSSTSAQPSSSGSSRPNRPSRTQETTAPKQQAAPAPRPEPREYSRPERSSSPAPSSSGSSYGSGSSSGSSSGGSSSGSSSGSRPSRGGR